MALVRPLALVLVVASLAGGITAAAGSQSSPITLAMRQYTTENKTRIHVWYGQVAGGATNEYVEVLGRDCLTKDYRLYAGTNTQAGGAYEIDTVASPFQEIKSGTTFRARWRDQLSNTVLHKTGPTVFYSMKLPKRQAWKVIVNPVPLYMKLGGKPVVLQRKRGGKWERFRSAPLVLKANYDYGGATNYEAVFEIPTRGLQLRALLQTKSVAPCYLGRATAPFRT